jgi:ABC-type iron transport system FetAB ATPase subunit
MGAGRQGKALNMLDREMLRREIKAILQRSGLISPSAEQALIDLFLVRCRQLYGDRDPDDGK